MLIVDLSLVRGVQHSPFQFYALPTCAYTRFAVPSYAHAHDDHYLTRSKFNSLLTEMITHKHTYKYIHIKPLPVPRVFGARSVKVHVSQIASIIAIASPINYTDQSTCRDHESKYL